MSKEVREVVFKRIPKQFEVTMALFQAENVSDASECSLAWSDMMTNDTTTYTCMRQAAARSCKARFYKLSTLHVLALIDQ